ncbi:MAG: antibiotic biosynthesis monooxygenase [Bacteroidota bacterium]
MNLNPSAKAQKASKLEANIVEITTFQLVEGTTDEAFLTATEQMQKDFLDKQAGFIRRQLAKGENGWVDIVFWESKAALETAMQHAESSEAAAPFIELIDFQSVQIQMNVCDLMFSANKSQ